jgi:hypothetical protein
MNKSYNPQNDKGHREAPPLDQAAPMTTTEQPFMKELYKSCRSVCTFDIPSHSLRKEKIRRHRTESGTFEQRKSSNED